MRDIILKQIQNNIPNMVLNLAIIVIPVLIIILTLTIDKMKIKPLLRRLEIYILLTVVVVIGIITIVPPAGFTINLVRDYNQPTILYEEGYVNNKSIRAKMPVITINNQQYYLSPEIGKTNVGDYCRIEYLENSKYITLLSVGESIRLD